MTSKESALPAGMRRNMLTLLGMVIMVGMGEYMAERFLPVYVVALGGGFIAAGGLNALDNLLSALYSFPGGYLSDRLGYKKALTVFNIIAMIGYGVVILFPVWYAVLAGAVFFLSWSAISLPATMSMVAKVMPANRRALGVSIHSLVRRIPMALGPIAGGALIATFGTVSGTRLAFAIALLLGAVSLFLQQRYITDDPGRKGVEKNPFRVLPLMSPNLRRLLIADILVRFCEQIPYAFLAIWCLQFVTPVQFGLLTTIEMITAMLVYLPVAYFSDRMGKKPFVVATFAFFTLFPLALFYSRSFTAMVFAFILRGLKEFGEPTRKALILDLAPEDRKAGMFGAYYLVRDIVVSIGAFGGAFLWRQSPAVNFFTALAFGTLGTVYFAVAGRDLSAS